MGLWQDKTRKDWRYRFEYQKKSYAAGGFKTKGEARAAREVRRKEVMMEAKQDLHPATPTDMGFVEVCNSYLDWSVRRHAKGHVENKKTVFRKFIEFLGNDITVSQITPQLLHRFLELRPSNNAYNVYRKEISALFNWSQKHLQLSIPNPCMNLDKLPVPKKHREIPTKQEFLKLLAACTPDERPLLVILAHTMARIDEILRLTWQDVNFERATLTLWSRKNRGGEWKSRTIAMNADLKAMLFSMWKRREQEKWVFYNEREDDRFLRRPKFMRSLCRRAGIQHYGFHAVRHFVATYLHDVMKIPTGVLSGILGHENKRTTEIYLHSVDEAARQAMTKLEGVFMLAADACGFHEKEPQAGAKDRI